MAKEKKILVIMDGIGPPNARGSNVIYLLQQKLAQMGADIHILTLIDHRTRNDWKEWMSGESNKHGIKFHYFNIWFFEKFHKFNFYFFKIFSLFAVFFLNRKHKFDIIHEYSSTTLLFYKAALLKFFIKGDIRFYNTLCTANENFLESLFSRGVKYLKTDKIICHSKNTRERLLKRGCKEKNVIYLPVGLEIDKYSETRNAEDLFVKYKIPKDKKIILYVGPMEEYKGVYLLAGIIPEIIKFNPDAFFIFVCAKTSGDREYGVNRKKLISELEECKSNTLLIEGLADIPAILNIADIFVYPLITPHGTLSMPLTLLEAMASGRAIIASSVGGNAEMIEDGFNGCLFSRGDQGRLISLINKLLENEDLANGLGVRARQTIKDNFNIEANAKRLHDLYQRQ